MITVRLRGTRVQVHPLMLMLPLLSAALGRGPEAAAFLLCLGVHEAGHLLCAALLGVWVDELRLMPIGGAARLGNVYLLSPARLFAVAAAGPAASLALVFVAAALAQWRWIGPLPALTLMRCSLTLTLFNLLPALPLDGGRMLYALAQRRLGRLRAVRLGVALGRAVSAALVAAALWGFAAAGRLNLSPLAAAAFILASAEGELSALTEARVSSLAGAGGDLTDPTEMRLCAVDAECPLHRALRGCAPGAATLFVVYRGRRVAGCADERRLLEAALVNPAQTVGEMLRPGRCARAV